VTMYNASKMAVGRGVDEEAIRQKILRLVRLNHVLVMNSEFYFQDIDTTQLQSLRTAQPHTIGISGADSDDNDDLEAKTTPNTITRYDVAVDDRKRFFELFCEPEKFYVRNGYDELYECICEQWGQRGREHVVLLGNAHFL